MINKQFLLLERFPTVLELLDIDLFLPEKERIKIIFIFVAIIIYIGSKTDISVF